MACRGKVQGFRIWVTRECIHGGNRHSVLSDSLDSFFCKSHVPSEARGTNSGFSETLFIYSSYFVQFMDLDGHNSNMNYKYSDICVICVEHIGLAPSVGMKFKHPGHID